MLQGEGVRAAKSTKVCWVPVRSAPGSFSCKPAPSTARDMAPKHQLLVRGCDLVIKINPAGGGTAAAHGANALLERLRGQPRPRGQAFPRRRTES